MVFAELGFRMLRLGPYPPPLIEISDPEDREIWVLNKFSQRRS